MDPDQKTGSLGGSPAVLLHGWTIRGDLCLKVPVNDPLVVAPGELVAVTGPNGSGKSTLLRLVAGLSALNEGVLTLAGRTVDDGTVRGHVPSHERRVGWVPQDRGLFDHLTVAANVGFSPRATSEVVEGLLERLDLMALVDRRPGECSGGQAQRVALARALAARPDVLLLDEPSTALDAESRHQIHDLLADRGGPGTGDAAAGRPATLLVSHDPSEVADLADRVVELAAGRIVAGLMPEASRP